MIYIRIFCKLIIKFWEFKVIWYTVFFTVGYIFSDLLGIVRMSVDFFINYYSSNFLLIILVMNTFFHWDKNYFSQAFFSVLSFSVMYFFLYFFVNVQTLKSTLWFSNIRLIFTSFDWQIWFKFYLYIVIYLIKLYIDL